jgi:threonine/homoserine/homoserine lactone efflux protein
MISAFVAALLGVMAAQASPGPNMMAVAGAALKQGRGAALLVVAGIATGSLVWAALTAFGLGELLRRFPQLLTVMMFVGAGYLLWLALRSLLSAWRGDFKGPRANADRMTSLGAWRRGLVVVLTNPKGLLMWSAIAAYLFGAGLPMLSVLAFGPFVAVTATLIYGAYGLIFSSELAGKFYRRFARGVEFVFGGAFGTLGAVLLTTGIRALRS